MRVQPFRLRGTVASHGDALALIQAAGDAALVKRGRLRSLTLVCPCGCGDHLTINLDCRSGPAWRYYMLDDSSTLFPSVWRETGCRSHFIIWGDRIYLFGMEEGDEALEGDVRWPSVGGVSGRVAIERLSRDTLEGPDEIADRLGLLPWEVLLLCRSLVEQGVAIEGVGVDRGRFRRR
jgi:hypothetical protein